MQNSESNKQSQPRGQAAALPRADGVYLVRTAFDDLHRSLSADVRASGATTIGRQKDDLRKWARDLGLLLTLEQLPETAVRGGQEHDLFHHAPSDRYFKVTRNGIFGLSPGIELALVSSSEDARRFHLWEATPLEYFKRLYLHNLLVPDINSLEGIVDQPDGELAIVTSQPRFDIVPVTEAEIDTWFIAQGFRKITRSAYYRDEDNLGVFDAHDKNVVRFEQTLIPFDIIPCHPMEGFLKFIQDTLSAGHTLQAVRTITTTNPPAK